MHHQRQRQNREKCWTIVILTTLVPSILVFCNPLFRPQKRMPTESSLSQSRRRVLLLSQLKPNAASGAPQNIIIGYSQYRSKVSNSSPKTYLTTILQARREVLR